MSATSHLATWCSRCKKPSVRSWSMKPGSSSQSFRSKRFAMRASTPTRAIATSTARFVWLRTAATHTSCASLRALRSSGVSTVPGGGLAPGESHESSLTRPRKPRDFVRSRFGLGVAAVPSAVPSAFSSSDGRSDASSSPSAGSSTSSAKRARRGVAGCLGRVAGRSSRTPAHDAQ